MSIEYLPEYRCPCCLKRTVEHKWFDDEGDTEGTRHVLQCTNCGRTTLPMDTINLAIEAFTASLATCWYANSESVLISMRTLNKLIKEGKELDLHQMENLDLRNRLG